MTTPTTKPEPVFTVSLRTLRFAAIISAVIATESLVLTLLSLLWDQAVWVVLITLPLFAFTTVFAGWCFRLWRAGNQHLAPE